jgi:peptide/nickel transport system permease protein
MTATLTAFNDAALDDQSALSGAARRGQRRFGNRTLTLGVIIIGLVAGFCVLFPMLSHYDPIKPNFAAGAFRQPSWSHPLGTGNFGRDTLTRVDLIIATSATFLTVLIGGCIGLMSGFFGGWIDTALMRLVDVVLTMPYLVLVIAIVAILGPGSINIFYAILLVGWVTYARLVRGETLLVRRLEYIEAARLMGMTNRRVMARHIVPNVVSTAIIYAMADIVLNILLASSLSFLGLGTQPPHPEWGLMVSEARDFFLKDWKLMTYPGLAIMLTGAGFGLIGDGLAQALRPKG